MKSIKNVLLLSIILLFTACVKNTNGSVTVVPLAPTNLTASVLSSVKVSLQWTDNATNETGYKIERKIATGNYAVVGTVLADITNFKDSSLSPNTTYTYRVYPYNAAGNSITYSNEVTVTTSQIVPNAPLTLTALVTPTNKVNLQWADNSLNENGFKIERKIVGGAYSLIGTTNANIINFTDSSVASNTNYTYRVFAYNGVGNSGYSNEVTILSKTVAKWSNIGHYGGDTIRSLVADKFGNIYTASSFSVSKWNGTSWSQLGGAAIYKNGYNYFYCDQVSTDANGNIYVAGFEYTYPYHYGKIYKWNGTSWANIGGSINSSFSESSYGDKMTTDAAGNVYVTENSILIGGVHHIKKFNGLSWSLLGTFDTSITALKVDVAGNIYAAIGAVGSKPYIAKFNGTSWSKLGVNNSFSFLQAGMYFKSLVTDVLGNTYALTENSYSTSGITSIYKFNGTSWSDIGGSNLPTGFQTASFAIDASGNVYASGRTQNPCTVAVFKWDGTSWFKLGGDDLQNIINCDYGYIFFTVDANGNVYTATNDYMADIAKYGY
jgi:chitodextrinase